MREVVMHTDLPFDKKSGKVGDIYDPGDGNLIIVRRDTMSTFDCKHPNGVPEKGKILTQMSAFWFRFAEELGLKHHMISADSDDIISRYPTIEPHRDVVDRRTMLVRKQKVVPIEAVVRGNLTGSGWKDYLKTGSVCGIKLPADMQESQTLVPPRFTPATKAEAGEHDENISFERACELVGAPVMREMRRKSVMLFTKARAYARQKGVIIADTKFEWAETPEGLELVDEILTPDSSRYWPKKGFKKGKPQPSYDKQPVRDWAESTGWDKKDPAPEIPEGVVSKTTERYAQAYLLMTGQEWKMS